MDADQTPRKPRRIVRAIALLIIAIWAFQLWPYVDAIRYEFRYTDVAVFDSGVKIPSKRSDKEIHLGKLPQGQWQYGDITQDEKSIFRSFVYASPDPISEIVDLVDDYTEVRFLDDSCAEYKGGEGYSCLKSENDMFVLEFNKSDIDVTPGGRFLLAHEIGHLVDYALFQGKGYEAFEQEFEASDSYKSCFKYEGDCVNRQELFADQMAYYMTGYDENFTVYQTPRLLDDDMIQKRLENALVHLDG